MFSATRVARSSRSAARTTSRIASSAISMERGNLRACHASTIRSRTSRSLGSSPACNMFNSAFEVAPRTMSRSERSAAHVDARRKHPRLAASLNMRATRGGAGMRLIIFPHSVSAPCASMASSATSVSTARLSASADGLSIQRKSPCFPAKAAASMTASESSLR